MSIARKTRAFFDYSYKLPFAVPAWDHRELAAISNCILKGQVARGPHTKPLEDRIRETLHAEYVLSFNSGRSAIEVALRALDLSPGDEVIVPSFCCLRAVLPITRSGCVPVFADVDDTLNIDPETIPGLCSPKTRAILVPHLFGRPARIDAICQFAKERSLFVIDDAAQAFGASLHAQPLGGYGDVGIVGFGPGKTLVATAGGILVTNRRDLFLRAQALSASRPDDSHLSRLFHFVLQRRFRRATLPLYVAYERFARRFVVPRDPDAYEVRAMANVDAAIGLVQLSKMDQMIEKRARYADYLTDRLTPLGLFALPSDGHGGVYTKYVVRLENAVSRAELLRCLRANGMEVELSYTPLHLDRLKHYARGPLPVTETLWDRLLPLPCEPSMSFTELQYVVETVEAFRRG